MEHHANSRKIIRNINRLPINVIQAFSLCYTGIVLDQLGKKGCMESQIKPIKEGMRVCGSAVTCEGPDLSLRRMGIDLAKDGDVLVVAAGGDTEKACFGDATALVMQHKGMSGIVIDGATRDVARLRQMNFPTFARSATPRNYTYPADSLVGGVNVPVICAGVLVRPGDIILGDDDGVIVISFDDAVRIAPKIVDIMKKKDAEHRGRIGKPYNQDQQLKDRGYVFE